jgi:hypothetical protein
VTWNDEVVFAGKVERSLKSIETSLEQRFDKQLAAPVILQFNRKNS